MFLLTLFKLVTVYIFPKKGAGSVTQSINHHKSHGIFGWNPLQGAWNFISGALLVVCGAHKGPESKVPGCPNAAKRYQAPAMSEARSCSYENPWESLHDLWYMRWMYVIWIYMWWIYIYICDMYLYVYVMIWYDMDVRFHVEHGLIQEKISRKDTFWYEYCVLKDSCGCIRCGFWNVMKDVCL